MSATLRTAQTEVRLEAFADAPRVSRLGAAWVNRDNEKLIPGRWKFNRPASHADARHVVFVYDSNEPRLRLSWEWRARAAIGPVEHTIRIQNLTGRELWLPLQDSFQFHWRVPPSTTLDQVSIEKGADKPSDTGVHRGPCAVGCQWTGHSTTYAHAMGSPNREIIPWFAIEDTAHRGWYAGLEFSARTRLHIERDGDSLSGAAGLDPEPGPFRTRLQPGESFETPVVFVGQFSGGMDGMGNVLRPWLRVPPNPLLVNNSWGGGMQVSEANLHRMMSDAADLGMEMLAVDAGWFRGVGDWYADPQKIPHGMAALAGEAHARGLKFGIWTDWTQAALSTEAGALNVRDPRVRDWSVCDLPADWKPQEFKGVTVDLGVPAVEEYALKETQRIAGEYHLDMLEHDGYLVAQGCVREDHPHAPPGQAHLKVINDGGSYVVEGPNSTDVSYRATRAYYRVQDALHRAYPGLLLEVCNDGGRMVDFGSALHGDYFSITDSYDPTSNRRAFHDTSYLLPAAMLESYVEKWPVPAIENFRYMLRSGMMGWLTVMMDTNDWTPEQHAAAKEEFRVYKEELRPLIREADLYHISARPDGVAWDGVEYFDRRRGRGVVYAFRGSIADENKHRFTLQGLDPAKSYRLRFHDHSSPDRTTTGSQLVVELRRPLSSELIFIDQSHD